MCGASGLLFGSAQFGALYFVAHMHMHWAFKIRIFKKSQESRIYNNVYE